MTPRHMVMGAALVAAAGLAAFGDGTPDSGVAEAVERSSSLPPRAAVHVASAPAAGPAILRLEPRASLVGEGDEAMGGSPDVFGRRDWTPPPQPAAPQAALPPAPPSAPPLPFTYLGKAAAGGSWEVYLARGDKTYVVRDKMIIDGTYRVDAIAPPALTLTYLPLNQVQQLNIGVLD